MADMGMGMPPSPEMGNIGGPGMPPAGPPNLPIFQYPINDYDNDEAHIAGHQNYCKTQEFENLDPMIQQIIIDHLNAHKERLQASLMTQPGMMPGTPQEQTDVGEKEPAPQ